MEKAALPTEIAQEPEEEAQQTLSRKMRPERKTNLNMVDNDKVFSPSDGSQVTSSYKDMLSQPASCMTRRQRLLWLQQRRIQGLWAQCDNCSRWRYLPDVLDRHDLPKKWYCRMNSDATFASCSAPEIPIRLRDEEDLIYSEYTAGSLVMARMTGWPWWPAMVDDCPDTERYYWLDGLSDIPTHYHVVFFDALEVSRAWLAPAQLKPYSEGKKLLNTKLKNLSINARIEAAVKQANDAEHLTQAERLSKYSFVARYKGDILSPKKVDKNVLKKYQDQLKRKFSIAVTQESDSESDFSASQTVPEPDVPVKRNVITLGSKKSKVGKTTDEENNEKCNDITNGEGVSTSLVVEVDTNSDLAKATFTEDTTPNTTAQTNAVEENKIPERAASPASDDFDF